MFNNNYNKNIFSGVHRLEYHLERVVDKLQGLPVSERFALGDIFADKKLNEKITTHCACYELNDPVVSHYPEINMQLLYLCLKDGARLDQLDVIGERGTGLRMLIEQSITDEGWVALEAAFSEVGQEEARWLQQQIAAHLFDRRVKRDKLFYTGLATSEPKAFFAKGLECGFLGIAAGSDNYQFVEIDRIPRIAIQTLLGSHNGKAVYAPFTRSEVYEAVEQLCQHPQMKARGFSSRMQVLDVILETLARFFVSTWRHHGVWLKDLHDALSLRIDALLDVYESAYKIRPFLKRATLFQAFYTHPAHWQELGIEWSHGLGVDLALAHKHKDPTNGDTGTSLDPLESMNRMSQSMLSGSEMAVMYRGLLEAVISGKVEPDVYAKYIGPYLISPYVAGKWEVHAMLNNLVKHSIHLDSYIPYGLFSDFTVENHPFDDTYPRILDHLALRALTGAVPPKVKVGLRQKEANMLLFWLNEYRKKDVVAAFSRVADKDCHDPAVLVGLFDVVASDFTAEEMAGFSCSIKRALLSKDMGL